MVGGHVAGVEMALRHLTVVPFQKAVEDLGQVAPLALAQPPDDAEIHGGQG